MDTKYIRILTLIINCQHINSDIFGENNMKSNATSKIVILIALGILFVLIPITTINLSVTTSNCHQISDYSDDSNLDNKNPKISAVSGKIHIDNNWTAAKAAGICTGNGTYFEPYVIDDLVIDSEFSGSCILIENSDVYFKIENCTLFKAYSFGDNAGIELYYANNGNLTNNNCSNNAEGIRLYRSNNNTVSGNIVNHNGDGIHIRDSDTNLISGNTVEHNLDGISIYSYSDNNSILGNTLNNNGEGIIIYTSNNVFSDNLLNGCGFRIHGDLENAIDSTNLVNGRLLHYYTNENGLGPNNFTNAGQVILFNCHNSIISNLNTSSCSAGISLKNCNNNNISMNTANNNYWYGISLDTSNNNTILGNTANNNRYGIRLTTSDYNKITGNMINDNREGIESGGDHNTISNNTFNNNDEAGIALSISSYNNTVLENIMNGCGVSLSGGYEIYAPLIDVSNLVNGKPLYFYFNETSLGPSNFTNAGQVILLDCSNSVISNLTTSNCSVGISLIYCDNIVISGNTAINNYQGLYLYKCVNNTITGNNASNNSRYGVRLSDGCDYNRITANIANNNDDFGIYLVYSDENTISKNTVNYNYRGIHLSSSDNNTISGCKAFNNTYGIVLSDYSDHNIVMDNTINNNTYYGINIMYYCDYNTISGNFVSHNTWRGIYLSKAHNNIISGNSANNNYDGLRLYKSDYNTLMGNTANYNNNTGISLAESNHNIITQNIANYNAKIGLNLFRSNFTTVTRNTLFGNNECIVEVECQGNTFENNECLKNVENNIPFEVIVLISSITGGVAIISALFLLNRRKRKRIE